MENMKTLIIIPSIRETDAFGAYFANFIKFNQLHDRQIDILVLNEEHENNQTIFNQLHAVKGLENGLRITIQNHAQRQSFFDTYLQTFDMDELIPPKSHDELSFGLLYALKYQKAYGYNMVVFVDDDTHPQDNVDFLGEHYNALYGGSFNYKYPPPGKTYVNTHPCVYVRGYPYSQRINAKPTRIIGKPVNGSVLNMGCWFDVPDLNAYDYLTNSERYSADVFDPRFDVFAVPSKVYAPICSMNLAFKPEIIPAFYQLYDNNRYNDMFSGVFLKRIADHLRANVSIGGPLVSHNKYPRDVYRDAAIELPSIKLNEVLAQRVEKIELYATTWLESYRELAFDLYRKFQGTEFDAVVYDMTRRMLIWCDACKKLGAV